MALRDNSLTKTNEQIFKASLIEMTKILKMERRQHSLYQQPLRLYVSADVLKYAFQYPGYNWMALSTFDVTCQFIQMLDPIHTQMGIEITPGRYPIQFNNSISPSHDGNVSKYYKFHPVNIEIQTINSSYYFNTKTNNYFARLPIVQLTSSSCVGLPLSDVNFVNNQNITFKATSGEYQQNDPTTPHPIFFQYQIPDPAPVEINYNSYLTFTLVFWKNTISEE